LRAISQVAQTLVDEQTGFRQRIIRQPKPADQAVVITILIKGTGSHTATD